MTGPGGPDGRYGDLGFRLVRTVDAGEPSPDGL